MKVLARDLVSHLPSSEPSDFIYPPESSLHYQVKIFWNNRIDWISSAECNGIGFDKIRCENILVDWGIESTIPSEAPLKWQENNRGGNLCLKRSRWSVFISFLLGHYSNAVVVYRTNRARHFWKWKRKKRKRDFAFNGRILFRVADRYHPVWGSIDGDRNSHFNLQELIILEFLCWARRCWRRRFRRPTSWTLLDTFLSLSLALYPTKK